MQNPNVAGDIAATSLGPARTYDQNTTTPAATDLSFDLTMAGTFVGSLA